MIHSMNIRRGEARARVVHMRAIDVNAVIGRIGTAARCDVVRLVGDAGADRRARHKRIVVIHFDVVQRSTIFDTF